ncbi:hypothetical protein TNCV_4892681 [Trichonephila clavipes]|nr:hypothetical protein TNCV_4892681 [Trichonephila clavipes]
MSEWLVHRASTLQVQGSNPWLGKVDSAFHPFCVSINEYQSLSIIYQLWTSHVPDGQSAAVRLNSYSKLMSYSKESFCYNELLTTEQMIKRAVLVCFHDVEIKNMCASLLESKRRRLEEVSYAKGRHTS